MLVKPERRREKGRPRMRWMDRWCGKGFEELGCKSKTEAQERMVGENV
jgi:hypothetical protein